MEKKIKIIYLLKMRFGTWNVRGLYRPGTLTAVARNLAGCRLDLVGVQKATWDKGGTVRAENYSFFSGKEKKIYLPVLSITY
jgi:hypothetical protein